MSYKPKVAVFGINGSLGSVTINALTSAPFADKIALPVIAITRDNSKETDTDLVVYKQAEVKPDAPAKELTDILKGVDVLLNVGSVANSNDRTLDAILKAGTIKLYVPSQFGLDLVATQSYFPNFLSIKTDHTNKARSLGIKTVDVITSLFAQSGKFLYEWIGSAGYNPATQTATFIGDPNLKSAISKLEDIGKALASLSIKDPQTIPDTVRIYSDLASQEDIVKRYEETHNVTIKREGISKEEGLKKAQALLAKGFNFNDFFLYLQVAASQGVDKGLLFSSDDREFVNPNESLFKWGKF
ncbi:NAD(P)-binding protein [Ascoidea rubescens DSM 1968]|uniref:NAD(P)-binding protein n=2 Tax=Ascoidea rubescens DSM 1968 TaxID=1344418 RepID=A0A1D2VGG0_9ASCO|nr:NAD(P)-binding protein [Ascoidea rubescens DSM 1968]ODV60630.1 NAD(P)-binding protein [Ascoidea rubescens DSM 1968]